MFPPFRAIVKFQFFLENSLAAIRDVEGLEKDLSGLPEHKPKRIYYFQFVL